MTSQMQIPVLGSVRKPRREVDIYRVRQCRHIGHAVALCLAEASPQVSRSEICDAYSTHQKKRLHEGTLALLISQGHGSDGRKRNFSEDFLEFVEDYCGNRAIGQYWNEKSLGNLYANNRLQQKRADLERQMRDVDQQLAMGGDWQ